MEEIWKDIEGYEGLYQVSNLGRIKSLCGFNGKEHYYREKILKGHNNGHGYVDVALYNYKTKLRQKHNYIHILVAKAFLPNPNKLEQVNHKNFNKSDNRVENLEWVTRKGNYLHFKNSNFYNEVQDQRKIASSNKTLIRIKQYKDAILDKYCDGFTIKAISKELGISRDFVADIVDLFQEVIYVRKQQK